MSTIRKLKGPCAHCQGPIEFDVDAIGQSVVCPYCRRQTELHLPQLSEEPTVPRKLVIWTVAAILILVLGLAAALYSLHLLEQRLAQERQAQPGAAAPGQ